MSEQPRVTLTHIPPCNDPDDSRETMAAQASPAAMRCTDTILWMGERDHLPDHLRADCTRWLQGFSAREGRAVQFNIDSYAVAAYLLGRRDGALLADEARPLACDDPAPSGALAWVFGALAGAGTMGGIFLLGWLLGY